MSILRTLPFVLAAFALFSCASEPASKPDPVLAREQHAVDGLHLKQHYKDVVMGTDIKSTTLILYVDENNLQSMDEPVEDAMIDDTLAAWTKAWSAAHPHARAKLRLSLRDYYGTEILAKTAQAG